MTNDLVENCKKVSVAGFRTSVFFIESKHKIAVENHKEQQSQGFHHHQEMHRKCMNSLNNCLLLLVGNFLQTLKTLPETIQEKSFNSLFCIVRFSLFCTSLCTLIRAKFGTCTAVGENGTLVEAQMFTFPQECRSFIFRSTSGSKMGHYGTNAKFSNGLHCG